MRHWITIAFTWFYMQFNEKWTLDWNFQTFVSFLAKLELLSDFSHFKGYVLLIWDILDNYFVYSYFGAYFITIAFVMDFIPRALNFCILTKKSALDDISKDFFSQTAIMFKFLTL